MITKFLMSECICLVSANMKDKKWVQRDFDTEKIWHNGMKMFGIWQGNIIETILLKKSFSLKKIILSDFVITSLFYVLSAEAIIQQRRYKD